MDAESRDAVFAALRAQGIRAIKVVASDGSKANGEIHGVRRRMVAVIAVIVAFLTAIVIFSVFHWGQSPIFPGDSPPNSRGQSPELRGQTPSFLTAMTRRQVIGDAAVIDKGIRMGWADVFGHAGDRFLASFAIPGVKAGVRNATEDELRRALSEAVLPTSDDSFEVQQIKAMVEGMKVEARQYLAAGGTLVGYGRRLVERQEAEIAIYKRAEDELEKAHQTMSEDAFMSFWEKRNDELRNLGIRLVALPE